MISSYAPPQLTITQRLATTTAAALPRMAACIVGPQYLMHRPTKDTDYVKATFASAGQTLLYQYLDAAGATQGLPVGHTADQSFNRLYASGLEASLYTSSNVGTLGSRFYVNDLTTPNVLRIGTAGASHLKGSLLNFNLQGRDVTVGDTVLITDPNSVVRRRKVVSLRGVTAAASYGSNSAKDDNDIANNQYNPITQSPVVGTNPVYVSAATGFTLSVVDPTAFSATVRGSSYAGRYGEEFTVTVATSGLPTFATVNISSTSGLWAKTGVATADASGNFSITSAAATGEIAGLSLLITPATPGAALTAGDTFVFRVFRPYVRFAATHLIGGDTGAGYTGTQDTTYVVTVLNGTTGNTFVGATLQITDTLGIDEASTHVVGDNSDVIPLGTLGLQITLAAASFPVQGGLRTGDSYYISAVAPLESTTNFDKMVLDGPAVDSGLFLDASVAVTTEFRIGYTGFIEATAAADAEAWTGNTTGITTDAGLALFVGERDTSYEWVAFVNGVGTLGNYWRATVPTDDSTGAVMVSSTADIIDICGQIDIDNELAFAASEGLNGSEGKPIFIVNTGGKDVDSFAAALRKLESTDTTVFIAGITADADVKLAIESHVEAMSQPDVKNFRRAYVGVDSPGAYVLVETNPDTGNPYTATIANYAGSNLLVTHTGSNLDFTTLGLHAKDLIVIKSSGVSYPIASVVSATELLLSSGPAAPIGIAVQIEVWKANTADNQVEFVQAAANAINSRRVSNVWYERGTRLIDSVSTVVPARFAAAFVAGRRSSLVPQQGLTRTEVSTITGIAAAYAKYSITQLNSIAAAGNFVITQDLAGGPVYIRHQLTTDTDNGSLYYEDSAGVIIDYVSLVLKDNLDGFIGKKNVTERTLTQLQARVINLLTQLRAVDLDSDIGPLFEAFTDPVVARHPTLRDRATVQTRLSIPLPFNNIDVVLDAVVA